MKNYLKFSGLICIALLMTGTTHAQSIPGTYFGIDNSNTELQVPNPGVVNGVPIGTRFSTLASGGTEFLDGGGFVPLWEERVAELSENGNPPLTPWVLLAIPATWLLLRRLLAWNPVTTMWSSFL